MARVQPERDGDAGGEAAKQDLIGRRPPVGPTGAERLVSAPRDMGSGGQRVSMIRLEGLHRSFAVGGLAVVQDAPQPAR